jgi:hypothetical protein
MRLLDAAGICPAAGRRQQQAGACGGQRVAEMTG